MAFTDNPSFTGLSQHLVASFFPLKRSSDGVAWERDNTIAAVSAPLTQASMELAVTWQSPFEGAGVESRFPALAQMAQAGMFSGVLNAIGSRIPDNMVKTKEFVEDIEKSSRQLVGRSGVTKLNSTQVFSGMPPVKIQVTALFKAFMDPQAEVETPLRRLQEWVLPQELAKDGVLAEFIKSGGDLLTLMPSKTPLCIGFAYKTRTFQPMVVESISDPLDAPIDKDGRRISAVVQMTLCSLTALDKADWSGTYRSL
jgi:hypothetical protein